MVHKDKRRALRRWRSYCKFMKRLRSDWNDHGWRRDPVRYASNHIDGTSLCDCFFPWSAQAVRFKDTPTGRFRKRDEWDDSLTRYRVERLLPVERERFGVRKRRRGFRFVKEKCMCGFVLGIVKVPFGQSSWAVQRPRTQCESCERRTKGKMMYWRNGKLLEFDQKPA